MPNSFIKNVNIVANWILGGSLMGDASALPPVGTANAGKVLTAGASNGAMTWEAVALDVPLPLRLGTASVEISDWDLAVENGWYVGDDSENSPTAFTVYVGEVIAVNNLWVTQTVREKVPNGNLDRRVFRRDRSNGVWGAWEELSSTVSDDALGELITGVLI